MKLWLGVLAFVVCLLSCGGNDLDRLIEKHEAAIMKGYATFPEADSLSKKYGVLSSIENFNVKTLPKTWQSEFILDERYLVVLAIPVDFSLETGALAKRGDAFVIVNEMTSITKPGAPGDQIEISYRRGSETNRRRGASCACEVRLGFRSRWISKETTSP